MNNEYYEYKDKYINYIIKKILKFIDKEHNNEDNSKEFMEVPLWKILYEIVQDETHEFRKLNDDIDTKPNELESRLWYNIDPLVDH